MTGGAVVSTGGHSGWPRPAHPPVASWFVYILASSAVIGGFLFGYDTGIASSTMLYVPLNPGMMPMNHFWQELIVSITPGMATFGALATGPASDRFGRKKIIYLSATVFTLGALVCAAAPEKIVLLIGRILFGFAIGFASMIVPIYIAEASPSHVRGTLITSFQLMINFGEVAANVIAGAFSYIDPVYVGWRLMFGVAAIPSIAQFIIFVFLPESPRWLYEQGRDEEAYEVVKKLYSGDEEWAKYELAEIKFGCDEERKLRKENNDSIYLRIIRTPHVRKALILACTVQAFQQLGGINTIMYYTATIIRSAGITDDHDAIWISVGTSFVNFLATLIPMFLIDKFGRRVLLMISVAGIVLGNGLMGLGFLLINNSSSATMAPANYSMYGVTGDVAHCQAYSNCDFCVTDESCGFCSMDSIDGEPTQGLCLPNNGGVNDFSTTGPCSYSSVMQNTPVSKEFNWSNVYCATPYTALPIIFMCVYLVFFSAGFAPLPWVFNGEFFPLWARSVCSSISAASNWIFNLIVSLTYLTLCQAIAKYGAFFLYGAISVVAVIFFFFAIPETKGLAIEEVEFLFMSKKAREEQEEEKRSKSGSKISINPAAFDTA